MATSRSTAWLIGTIKNHSHLEKEFKNDNDLEENYLFRIEDTY